MTVIEFMPYTEYRYIDDNKGKLCHKANEKIHLIWREHITKVFEIDFKLTNENQYAGIRYDYKLAMPLLTIINPKPAKILMYNRRKEEKSR